MSDNTHARHENRTSVLHLQQIPQELRQREQWVVWRRAKSKNDKPPLNARTLQHAKSDDRATWSTFEQAALAVEEGRAAGVGFVFTEEDGLFFLDLDGVIDDEGELTPWAQEYVKLLDTYTERSMSGHGLHIIGRGDKPGSRARNSRIELYDRVRYCAMTGDRWNGTPSAVESRQEALNELYARQFGGVDAVDDGTVAEIRGQVVVDSDAEPPADGLRQLLANDKFRATWEGQRREFGIGDSHDQSRYDQSLASFAARAKWSDQEITDLLTAHRRIHGGEEAVRKLHEHSTYLARTIATAGAFVDSEMGCKLTDMGNAHRMILRHGENLRYCTPQKSWLWWDGTRWKTDEIGRATELAKETVRSMYAQAAQMKDDKKQKDFTKAVRRQESAARIEAMLRMARSEPGVAVLPKQLDQWPWKLNAPNGTIDLITGDLLPHEREDLITMSTEVDYDPDARSDLLDAFLERVLPDPETRAFLQRLMGAALHGGNREEIVVFLFGQGSTGKSTLLAVMLAALCDYATSTDLGTFLGRARMGGGGASPHIARLAGRRLVTSYEIQEGTQLNVSLVNQLTGGDPVVARGLHKDPFEFLPQFTPVMATNEYPRISSADSAVWRRIKVINFDQVIPEDERDKTLKTRLREPRHAKAALAWLVEGCIAWQRDGLNEPSAVRLATREYRDSMDFLQQFIDDCMKWSIGDKVSNARMWKAYMSWCRRSEAPAMGRKTFTQSMHKRGHMQDSRRAWVNTAIRVDTWSIAQEIEEVVGE